jgi:glycosyltransferase involved in cell wall biosynthesis
VRRPEWVVRRRDGLQELAATLRAKYSQSTAFGESVRESFSDLRFSDASRVPYPFARAMRDTFSLFSVVTASRGPYLQNLDGHWTLDVSGSYGLNVAGFERYKEWIEKGWDRVRDLGPVLGPVHPVVAENIEMLKRASSLDEVSFHMSGTEAVMAAVRLARFNTRRKLIVCFSGAYHGWWDGVQPGLGSERTLNDCLTLKDLNPASLAVIRRRAKSIAAVLVNPVQSFHPNSPPPNDAILLSKSAAGGDLVPKLMREVFGRAQTPPAFKDRVSYYARRIAGRSERSAEQEFKRMVSSEMVRLFGEDWLEDDFVANAERYEELNRRTFELSSKVANQLLFQFSRKFVERLSTGSLFGSLEALSAAGPILLGIAPYLFSFAHQNRDRAFLADIRQHFLGPGSPLDSRPKKGWFTDTLTDVNGVTTLIRTMCRLAQVHEHDLTLMSVSDVRPDYPGRVQNFRPVGTFAIPEHESVSLAFPPFLDIVDYCDREQFTELIVSTPGLAGLAALAAGKMLNIRLVGIYHADLPQYIRYYTEDEAMESAAWRYLRWFSEQMDLVLVPSRAYHQQLVAKGLDARKLRLFPHGTDLHTFRPSHRNQSFWSTYGASGGPTVAYVGRVAKEKDLDVLIDVYGELARRRPECRLCVVGDGPYLPQMKQALAHANVVFTGFLFDRELSAACASSDILVFPSTTDTFGSVVLEAMASGVPVIVSDRGGACELVQHGRTGLVTKGRSGPDLLAAVEHLLDRADVRRQLSSDVVRVPRVRGNVRVGEHLRQFLEQSHGR